MKRAQLVAAAVVTAGTLVATAAPASAGTAVIQGCQTSRATMTWSNGNTSTYSCSGTYYPSSPNIYGRSFYAAGWSGELTVGDDGPYYVRYFCDFNKLDLGGVRVWEVMLNATKPARCK